MRGCGSTAAHEAKTSSAPCKTNKRAVLATTEDKVFGLPLPYRAVCMEDVLGAPRRRKEGTGRCDSGGRGFDVDIFRQRGA